MNVETGLTRVAKAIAVLGWAWAGLCAAAAVFVAALNLMGRGTSDMWVVIIASIVVGAAGLGAALGMAWIIRGFAQGRSEQQ
jgi:hypothetical protein